MWRTGVKSIPAAGACEELSEESECKNGKMCYWNVKIRN